MLLIARDPFAHLPQASEFRDSYLSRNSPNVEPPRADVFSGPTTSSDRRAAEQRDEFAPLLATVSPALPPTCEACERLCLIVLWPLSRCHVYKTFEIL
jgi:hypothetical protein